MADDSDRNENRRLRVLARRQGKSRPARKGSPAGRPTPEELERRILRVLEVATQLFIEKGYAGVSLVEIAKIAGVATRTIYFHFGDKEELFREVIHARDAEGAIAKPQVISGDTLFSALRRTCDYAYAVTSRKQSVGLMRLMIAESSRFPDFMSTIGNSIFARFRKNIEKVFIELEHVGLIPRADHSRSAEIFSDVVQGSHPIMIYTDWNVQLPSDHDLDERIEIFIKGRLGLALWKTAKTKKAKFPDSKQ